MKVKGYRINSEVNGVTVWELSEFDLPLVTVLKNKFVSIEEGRRVQDRDEIAGCDSDDILSIDEEGPDSPDFLSEDTRSHTNLFFPRLLNFRKRPADSGVVSIKGVVTAQSAGNLVDFAMNNLVPGSAGSRVEKLVEALHEGCISEGECKARLEQLLESGDCDLSGEWPLFKIKADKLKSYSAKLASGGTVLMERSRNKVVIFREDAIKVGRSKIPRHHFIIHSDQGIASWDGVKWLRHRPDGIPSNGLTERLERDGKSVREMEIYDAPLCDMEPAFLVRIPFTSEIRRAGRKKPGGHQDLLSRPWFMIDTRRAVPMPDDGKLKKMTVITEPAEALHVLRRLTGRNVYIPGQALMMDEDVRTSDPYGRETFLAACLPKRI